MTPTLQALQQQLQQLRAQHAAGSIDDARFATEKAQLERQLLDQLEQAAPAQAARPRAGVQTWALLGVFSVVLAVVGYSYTGSPDKINAVPGEAGTTHDVSEEQMAVLVQRLAERMQANPDDAEGWLMLGRSYAAMGRTEDAMVALDKAVKLRPDDASVLADYADALAVKNGSTLEGEPTRLIERALKSDPNHLKALVLGGTAAFNRGDYAGAVKHWDHAVQVGPEDNPLVQMAGAGAAEARERGKLPPAAPVAPSATAVAPPTSPAGSAAAQAAAAARPTAPGPAQSISGTVTLKPEWQARVSPEDTVYVYARAASGSRMPLALLQKKVKDLPIRFMLDDSMAMSPAAKLSGAGQVIVGARITKSGQAMAQPGDLEGASEPVTVGGQGVAVVIASEVK